LTYVWNFGNTEVTIVWKWEVFIKILCARPISQPYPKHYVLRLYPLKVGY